MEDSVQTSAAGVPVDTSAAAYRRRLPEIEALGPEDTMHINLDIMQVATVVMGCLPRVIALREELARLPDFDLAVLDTLDDYTGALQHAHVLYLQAAQPAGALELLVPEASALRDVLHADALACVKRGLLPAEAVREVRRANGHRALILDLSLLSTGLRAAWPRIAGRSGVSELELGRADTLVAELTAAVGARDHAPVPTGKVAQLRAAAYTLLVRRYEELRHAALYTRRRHGDADEILPSLFSSQGARRARSGQASGDAGSEVAPAEVPSAPAPSPLPDLQAQLATSTFSR